MFPLFLAITTDWVHNRVQTLPYIPNHNNYLLHNNNYYHNHNYNNLHYHHNHLHHPIQVLHTWTSPVCLCPIHLPNFHLLYSLQTRAICTLWRETNHPDHNYYNIQASILQASGAWGTTKGRLQPTKLSFQPSCKSNMTVTWLERSNWTFSKGFLIS